MRAPRVLLVALVLLAASATTALACSCLRFKSAREQFDKAELIFVGRAEGRELTGRDVGPPTAVTRFMVQRTLKGPRDRTRRVAHSEETAGMCGIRFRRGQTYLVIAYRSEGRWRTNSCSAPQFPRAEFERLAARRR